MSGLKSTLSIDGVAIEDGSPEMVEAYLAELRKAQAALNDASQLAARCPEAIKPAWGRLHHDGQRKLSKLIGRVRLFSTDFRSRGLESALEDARWRKEL